MANKQTSYLSLHRTDAENLLRLLHRSGLENPSMVARLGGHLEEYVERFKNPRAARESNIRRLAQRTFKKDGELEIDTNAVVSEGDENGAYVLAWKWLSFDDTKFDKEKA